MLQKVNTVLHLFIATLIMSCGPPPTLEGFDKGEWTMDKFACKGLRSNYLNLINDNKTTLLRLNQNEIENILGLPDEHELDKRKRKYFYYNLQPGLQCDSGKAYPIRLQIKFNALGQSSEVFLENY